jgi:hypothetical protein
MHFLAIIALAAFWSSLTVKLVAISGLVYLVVQMLKAFFPQITGPWAIALNFALSMAGTISVAKPGDLSSLSFWSSLLMAAGAAAGIHGTVKSFQKAGTPTSPLMASVGAQGAGGNDLGANIAKQS